MNTAFDIVIFGGFGDLALRKLLPALFHRMIDCQILIASGWHKTRRKSPTPCPRGVQAALRITIIY